MSILMLLLKGTACLLAAVGLLSWMAVGLRFLSWKLYVNLYPGTTFKEYCKILDDEGIALTRAILCACSGFIVGLVVGRWL